MITIPLEKLEPTVEQLIRKILGSPWSNANPFSTEVQKHIRKEKKEKKGFDILIEQSVQNVYLKLADSLASGDDEGNLLYLLSKPVCFTDAFELRRFKEQLKEVMTGDEVEHDSDEDILAESLLYCLGRDKADEWFGLAQGIYAYADNAAKHLTAWGPARARDYFVSLKRFVSAMIKSAAKAGEDEEKAAEEAEETYEEEVHETAFDLYCLMCRKYALSFYHFRELYDVSPRFTKYGKFTAAMLRYPAPGKGCLSPEGGARCFGGSEGRRVCIRRVSVGKELQYVCPHSEKCLISGVPCDGEKRSRI